MQDIQQKALAAHLTAGGKLETVCKLPLRTMEDLSVAYTPGVAAVCLKVKEDKANAYHYTIKKNTIAVVTDGSAVLGLGNIGPEAALPVMEGKCALFKTFANVDAFPICLDTQDTGQIVAHIKALAPTFAGINLEDIAAPRCFEVERQLKTLLDIPIFHDDQHGTAIVVLAALLNAMKLIEKNKDTVRIVINGSGAAGIAIAELLLAAGIRQILMVDKEGILSQDNPSLPAHHQHIAQKTNPENRHGSLKDALQGSDVFIGVSAPGVLQASWIHQMNSKPVILAMANPTPEIFPEEALAAGAYIVGTGRSDFPNQINNVLAFPGIFRGAIDVRAKEITQTMQLAAAQGIANKVSPEQLAPDYIIPAVFEPGLAQIVAQSVIDAATQEHAA